MQFRTKRGQFISNAKEQISVNTGESEQRIKHVKRKVARNMYKVAKYAARMGMPINADDIPKVIVDINDQRFNEKVDAEWSGIITLRAAVRRVRRGKIVLDRPWKNSRTIAHEVFHMEQERRDNMPYLTGSDKAYTEGGAVFFANAYAARHNKAYLSRKKSYILGKMDEWIGSDKKRDEMQKEFRGLKSDEKAEFLNRLLRPVNAATQTELLFAEEPDSMAKYRRGTKFAAISFMSNRYNIRETIDCFLNKRLDEHIEYLSATAEPRNAVIEFIGMLRTYPVPARLEHLIRKHVKK